MKDKGLDMGLIKDFDTSIRGQRGWNKRYWGFRKMFWDYLNKLEVPFYDICCEDASDNQGPVRFNSTSGSLEYFNGTVWIETNGGGASATAIIAHPGGGQGSATQLTAGYNEITVVATAGDSVKLPSATVSTVVIIKNDGVASLDVFPFTGDTINDGTVNVAIPIAPQATVSFYAVDATNWETSTQVVGIASGSVGAPSYTFNADPDTGFYRIGANNIGVSANGAKVLDISPLGLGITGPISLTGVEVNVPTTVAKNSTTTLSAADMLSGYITSTSGAATNLTTPTATALGAGLLSGAGVVAAKGVAFEFSIDNVAGANVVTLVLDASIAVTTPVITGTNTLTISVANGIGRFRVVFTSGTTAKIFRLF